MPKIRHIDEREDMLSEKVPLDVDEHIAPQQDSPPPGSRSCRDAVVLSTSTHYGWALCAYWDELRPTERFPNQMHSSEGRCERILNQPSA